MKVGSDPGLIVLTFDDNREVWRARLVHNSKVRHIALVDIPLRAFRKAQRAALAHFGVRAAGPWEGSGAFWNVETC